MSDENTIAAAQSASTAPAPAAPDVSAPSAPDAPDNVRESSETSFVQPDVDFDRIFGLPPEESEADVDVPEVTDTPDPRQIAEVKDEPPIEEPKAEPKETAEVPKAAQLPETDKLDFKTAPKDFREHLDATTAAHKELHAAYVELLEASPAATYLSQPEKFRDWMKETSPTSYDEVGRLLVNESAEAHPKEWIQYMLQRAPDLVAQLVSGREDLTLDRLKAELSILTDDDDEDVLKRLELLKKGEAEPPKEETEEQKAIREWREEKEQTARQEVTSAVLAPIETEINKLVSDAGLGIELSDYQGKEFGQLDEDTQFKIMVNEIIPLWIDLRIQNSPQLRAHHARLQEFIEKKDKKSALGLQHVARIAATNAAKEVVSLLTGKRISAKKQEAEPPNREKPPPNVKTAGASAPLVPSNNGTEEIDWSGEM